MDTVASHSSYFMKQLVQAASAVDQHKIEVMARELDYLRARNGRLFLLGVGGSAANCSHAVNDFRKLCNIQAFAPTDNVAELSARTNDEGWESAFAGYLKVARLTDNDALVIMSVGGGSIERGVSTNLVHAITLAQRAGAQVFAIVGRQDGYAARVADHCIVVGWEGPWMTPIAETLQAAVWHCLVSHPVLQRVPTKW